MATIKKVSTSTTPNDVREDVNPDGGDYRPIPKALRQAPNFFPTAIPENIFDTIRTEAREARYDNTAEERETLAAVDDAIFDRVRPLEQSNLARAQNLLADTSERQNAPRPNVMQVAEAHVAELHLIREELRAGRDTAALADRYRKVQEAIQTRDAGALLRRAREAELVKNQLADPLAHAQKILHMMPLANFRPLGIRNW